jgi:hypothetical protein
MGEGLAMFMKQEILFIFQNHAKRCAQMKKVALNKDRKHNRMNVAIKKYVNNDSNHWLKRGGRNI